MNSPKRYLISAMINWIVDNGCTPSASARMAQRLTSSREGRAVYAQRKWMAEAPIGWIKHVMGFRRFSVRRLE